MPSDLTPNRHTDRPAPPRTPRQQAGRLTRPLIALVALSVLGASATAITYLITHPAPPQAPQPAAPAPLPAPIFVNVEPFTVTLHSRDYDRMLHVGVTLKVADDTSRQRLQEYMPVVRSRILLLLSEQDPETVHTGEAKRALANAVRHALNAPLAGTESQQVIDVLFTAFVVQ